MFHIALHVVFDYQFSTHFRDLSMFAEFDNVHDIAVNGPRIRSDAQKQFEPRSNYSAQEVELVLPDAGLI